MNRSHISCISLGTFNLKLLAHVNHFPLSIRPVCSSSRHDQLKKTSNKSRIKESLVVQSRTDVEQEEQIFKDSGAKCFDRRHLVIGLWTLAAFTVASRPMKAYALGFKKNLKKRRTLDESLYTPLENGLKIYDLEEGTGQEIVPGTHLKVHYDCKFRGIDVVSSRSARLLGGNRIVAEPLDFVAGEPIVVRSAKIDDRGGGGLFAGISGPKPPPALSTAVYGMKKGGKRSVIVPPELGYGSKGIEEIPPNTSFELLIEILQIN
eukprot:g3385.t1